MAILTTPLFRPVSPRASHAAPAAAVQPPALSASLASRLNWLRAGVLGANDGIVSVAAIVVGVAGAGGATPAIVAAGAAGLVGGAISMALGEYVSVSSQSDSQRAMIEKQKRELRDDAAGELDVLTGLYEERGLAPATARQVAIELTEKDALKAHLSLELNITEDEVANPWHAAGASALAFVLGAVLPLLAILLPPEEIRVPVTFVAVLVALAATGALGAALGGSRIVRATVRVLIGGAAALAVTWLVGTLLGVTVF
jgi:VIT1/CCC1 family predicted Fe2+/Mn2+ transporter